MKKILIILLVIFLTSCSLFNKEKEEDISKAKQELLWDETWTTQTDSLDTSTWESITQTWETVEEKNNLEPTATITPLDDTTPLIEIEDLSNKDFYAWEFYINWNTLWNVDKIEVSFSNKTSTYPEDLYRLREFNPWDKAFKYMASSNFKTLDFWLNEYIFTAYSWNSTYKIKVDINIPEKEVRNTSNPEEARLNSENLVISDVNNLKVENDDSASEITCESEVLTNYLVENYGYSYWNSCRDIIKDKSIWFYVLRLSWDKYFYEKHYIDYEKKLHGVLLLETWTWVTKDMIKEKNDELKQMSFDETLKADLLFKK